MMGVVGPEPTASGLDPTRLVGTPSAIARGQPTQAGYPAGNPAASRPADNAVAAVLSVPAAEMAASMQRMSEMFSEVVGGFRVPRDVKPWGEGLVQSFGGHRSWGANTTLCTSIPLSALTVCGDPPPQTALAS